MAKVRLIELVLFRGLATSTQDARGLILSGRVLGNGQRLDKEGALVPQDIALEVLPTSRFVGRGGEKLDAAITFFKLNLKGKIAIDLGASTGGFTDCLLQHGAEKVYSVDVGKGQLDWKLRNDPRVVVLEGVNAKHLAEVEKSTFSPLPCVAAIDLSFTSVTAVLPGLVELLNVPAWCLVLVKPHFELSAEPADSQGSQIEATGGVVIDETLQLKVCERVSMRAKDLGFIVSSPFLSPLRGQRGGNAEYFLLLELKSH